MSTRLIQILLIQDNPTDGLPIVQACQAEPHHSLQAVEDNEAALAYLRRQGMFSDAPRPDLVLLDLKTPQKDGRQVLREMRAQADLKDIPVIILTDADTEDTHFKTYAGYANAYICKPLNPADFTTLLRGALRLWLDTA
jgi:two-component system, chemotaxis family, response regulator Rcp1